MAEEQKPNEQQSQQQKELQNQQQIVISNQYIKDLSFENPNAPASFAPSEKGPEVEVNVNLNAIPQEQPRTFEVVLGMRATAKRDDKNIFLAELSYAAVVSIPESVEDNLIHPLVMIEGPRLLFPFARQMLSTVIQAGGHLPFNMQPIDFVRLYQASMESRAAEAEKKGELPAKDDKDSDKKGKGDAKKKNSSSMDDNIDIDPAALKKKGDDKK